MFDRFDKSILSKQLYYFAWAVEIVAVMIGLALSVITAITYFDSAGVAEFADYMNAIVGTLPFIIVAIVEFLLPKAYFWIKHQYTIDIKQQHPISPMSYCNR
jgi:hypothetical protein